jgi:hypothetical protein
VPRILAALPSKSTVGLIWASATFILVNRIRVSESRGNSGADREARSDPERSLPFQESDQFLSRKSRFPQQREKRAFPHVAIVLGHDGAML